MKPLPDQHVGAAFDHLSGAAAMGVPVAFPVRGLAVDPHRLATFRGDPSVRAATGRVDAGIAGAQCWLSVHKYVGRSGHRRTHRGVRATFFAVSVHGNRRLVSETGLWLHLFDRDGNTLRD